MLICYFVPSLHQHKRKSKISLSAMVSVLSKAGAKVYTNCIQVVVSGLSWEDYLVKKRVQLKRILILGLLRMEKSGIMVFVDRTEDNYNYAKSNIRAELCEQVFNSISARVFDLRHHIDGWSEEIAIHE